MHVRRQWRGMGGPDSQSPQKSVQTDVPQRSPPHAHSLHPYDTGHQALAELLVQPLARAVREVEAGEALGKDDVRHPEELTTADLPPPMIPGNLDEEPGFCALLASAWVGGRGAWGSDGVWGQYGKIQAGLSCRTQTGATCPAACPIPASLPSSCPLCTLAHLIRLPQEPAVRHQPSCLPCSLAGGLQGRGCAAGGL